MRWIRVFILIVLVAMIETSLLPHLSLDGMRPDIALIFVLFISLHTGPIDAVPAGWMMGLAKDIYSVGTFGANAFILSLCAACMSRAKDYVYKDHPLAQLVLVIMGALLCNGLYLGILLLSPQSAFGSPEHIALRLLYAVTLTALPAPFLLVMLRVLKPWLGLTDKITL